MAMLLPEKFVEYDEYVCKRTGDVLYVAYAASNSKKHGGVCETKLAARKSLSKHVEDTAFAGRK